MARMVNKPSGAVHVPHQEGAAHIWQEVMDVCPGFRSVAEGDTVSSPLRGFQMLFYSYWFGFSRWLHVREFTEG